MGNETIIVDIRAGTSTLASDTQRAESEFGGAISHMEKAAANLDGSVAKLGGQLKNAGGIADAITADIVAAIQKVTHSLQAGEKGTRQYFEAIATQRGVDPNVLAPYLAQLEQMQAKLAATTQAEKQFADDEAFRGKLAAAALLNQASEYVHFWGNALDQADAAQRQFADDEAFRGKLAAATLLNQASEYVRFWGSALDQAEAAERQFADDEAFRKKLADAALLNQAAGYVHFWESSLESAEAAERQLASQNGFIEQLRKQSDAIGKTRADLLEMQAAQLGVTDAAAPFIARLRESESAVARTGLTAGQMSAALAGVPAQFTDIAVSLAAGQQPLMVLLQQGGQLKDMFGGVAPAAQALGNYIRGLVTPLNLSAAAIGVLAFAAYQGYEESKKLHSALLMTNGAAGLTEDAFNSMAASISVGAHTAIGSARETLLGLVQAGQLSGQTLENTAASAEMLAKITGGSAADAVKELAEALNGPIENLISMNGKMGFLTASEYEHIQALQESGKAEQAKFELSQQMYDHFKEVSEKNIGSVESMWQTLIGKVSEYWDVVKSIGRESSVATQIAGNDAEIKQLSSTSYSAALYSDRIAKLKAANSDLIRAQTDANRDAARSSAAAAIQANGIKAVAKLNKLRDDVASPAEKRSKAIADLNKTIATAQAAGAEQDITPAEIAQLKKGLLDKYKDPKDGRGSAAKFAAREQEKYGDLLNKLSGISGSYNNSLNRLFSAYSGGKLTLEQYRHEVEQLILTQTDIGKAAKKQIESIAAINAKIDAEQLAIDTMQKYGIAAGELNDGEKEAIKLRRLAAVAENEYVKSNLEAQAVENDHLGVMQRRSKEAAAYYTLQKQISDAAAQAAFDSQQWRADAAQEIRLLGISEPYRTAAQAQYEVEKQTKKELFAIQQQINQAIRDESAAKDDALKADIVRRRGQLEGQYKTVETDGVKKSGQAGAQALTVQAKNAATEASKAARSMSAAWAASGDSVVKSIGQMMSAMGDYASQQADFAKEQAALDEQRGRTAGIADIEARGKAETALNTLQIDLDKRRTDNNLAGTAQMMGLASQMFAEGSRGRKAAHAMEMTFLAIEISQKTASAVVDAVKAVANQGSGDPYTAIPRAIAMAAMMAGVLSQIGASFSAGGGVASQALNTSSTVLGSTDPSQSVGNSLDWLQKLEADQYAELRGINSGMRDLNRSLSGVASAIYRNAGLTGKLPSPGVIGRQMGAAESFARDFAFTGIAALDNLLPGISGFFKNVIGGLAGKIFGGGSTTSIVGSGIMSGQTTLGNVMNGGILDVLAWQRTKTETDGGWFGSDETSYGQNISDIGGEVEQLMTQVFAGLGKTMLSVGEQLNIDASAAIKALSIQLPQIDLGGKSGADMQKAIEEAVSAVSDNAVSAVFGNVLRQYQHLNEGLLETATRTVGEMAVVNDALRMTGYGIKAAGLDASQSLVGLAGGATELHSAAESFFKSYYSETEQSVFHAQRLQEQFAAMNIVAPQTKGAFRALVESQDITTEAGRKTYASLLSVAGAFDDVVASADKLKNTLTSWLQSHQLGDQSVLSTEQKYGVARQQFDDMLQKAGSGDADAQGKLTSAADALLGLARDMFASGGQYVSLESYVTSQIQRLAGAIKLPGFATGGLAQGWAIVGEQGPELVNFSNPGRVYTADDTRNMLDWSRYGRQDNGALVAEVRALREEVSRMRAENTELQQAQLAQRGQLGQMQMRQQDEQNRLAKRIAGNNALS